MNKHKIKADIKLLVKTVGLHKNAVMPYDTALQMFGPYVLKKARRRELVAMDPDPHTGRTSKTVGQQLRQMLPGGKLKKGVATNTRFGNNISPEKIMLTPAGRALLQEKGV